MKRIYPLEIAVLTALLACVPLKAAFAYIDPNSAGWLYQILFPVLIAIGTAFAALRRMIARAWSRLSSVVVAAVRGERVRE